MPPEETGSAEVRESEEAVTDPEEKMLPWTERACEGLVVPMPTFPLLVMMKLVAVEEPTTKEGAALLVAVGLMERIPHGVEEP